MNCNLLSKLLVLVGCASLLAGCDEELCGFGKVGGLRCEGDVHVYCPGGWGTIDFTANREDCAEQGKVCVGLERYNQLWTGCEKSFGPCAPETFKSYCRASDQSADYASMVLCVSGEQVQIGEQCSLKDPTPASGAGGAPQTSER